MWGKLKLKSIDILSKRTDSIKLLDEKCWENTLNSNYKTQLKLEDLLILFYQFF